MYFIKNKSKFKKHIVEHRLIMNYLNSIQENTYLYSTNSSSSLISITMLCESSRKQWTVSVFFFFFFFLFCSYLSTRKYSKSESYKTKQAKIDSFNWLFIHLVLCSRLLSTFDFICNPAKGTQLINVAMWVGSFKVSYISGYTES